MHSLTPTILLALLASAGVPAAGCRSSPAGPPDAAGAAALPATNPPAAAAPRPPAGPPAARTDGDAVSTASAEPVDAGPATPDAAGETDAATSTDAPSSGDRGGAPDAPSDSPRVGAGGFCVEEGCAAAWGLVEEAAEDGSEGSHDARVEATVEDGRHLWVLFRIPGRGPDYDRIRAAGGGARWTLWLARLESATDPGEGEGFRRSGAVRLYEFAQAADELRRDCEPGVSSELRACDLDGDREVEVTVIAAVAAAGMLRSGEECGAVAFLVGGDDFGIQARFTREYRWALDDAGGDSELARFTTWRLDEPADGAAPALRVTEVLRVDDRFSGDWGGEQVGTVPGRSHRENTRRQVRCPYAPDADAWLCPPEPTLGTAFFRTADEVLSPPDPWRATDG